MWSKSINSNCNYLQSVKKTGRCIIAHEAPYTGGFGAELAASIQVIIIKIIIQIENFILAIQMLTNLIVITCKLRFSCSLSI